MTRSLGARLSPALAARLSQRDLEQQLGVVLPFITVDAAGRPHPMLLSYVEIRAYDPGSIGLVIDGESRSARNLSERRAGTRRLEGSRGWLPSKHDRRLGQLVRPRLPRRHVQLKPVVAGR